MQRAQCGFCCSGWVHIFVCITGDHFGCYLVTSSYLQGGVRRFMELFPPFPSLLYTDTKLSYVLEKKQHSPMYAIRSKHFKTNKVTYCNWLKALNM
jgi:hypothetical protein